MKRTFRRLSNSFATARRKKPRRESRRLRFESLENRELFTVAALAFGGEWLTSDHAAEGGWSEMSSQWFDSFHSLFRSSRPWMDANGDGRVSRTDADIAVNRITEKVREHYAPYDISIVVGDQDDYQHRLNDSSPGDTIVVVTGESDFDGNGALGRAHVDAVGNPNDEIAFVFGRGHLTYNTIEQFVTQVAVTISHELGHTLGLSHVTNSWVNDYLHDGAHKHHIMYDGVGDASRNSNFQDLSYFVAGGGLQNAHDYLTDTLGESTRPWAAVLKPGTLYVDGSQYRDVMSVYPASYSDDWIVSIHYEDRYLIWRSMSYRVDPTSSPGMDSINPFSEPIRAVRMDGEGGNDTLSLYSNLRYSTNGLANGYLNGGSGNDTLRGGSGRDYLYGQSGHDYLYGNGGRDYLNGGSGRDYLDGGHDEICDTLVGGTDRDTFVFHVHTSALGMVLEDDLRDIDFREDTHKWYFWSA